MNRYIFILHIKRRFFPSTNHYYPFFFSRFLSLLSFVIPLHLHLYIMINFYYLFSSLLRSLPNPNFYCSTFYLHHCPLTTLPFSSSSSSSSSSFSTTSSSSLVVIVSPSLLLVFLSIILYNSSFFFPLSPSSSYFSSLRISLIFP